MKYLVLEIQTNADGSVGTIVSAFDSGNLAEQKYHTILSFAAVSTLPSHAAVIMTNEGHVITKQCYKHAVVTEPVAEVTEEQIEGQPE